MNIIPSTRSSVTRILDAYTEPEIWEWKLRVGKAKSERVSQEALSDGKEIDRLIQEDIKGNGESLESKPESIQNAFKGWQLFKFKYPDYVSDIKGIQVELIADGLIGHPDILHFSEVADIKTSSQLIIRPKWVVQSSKYALMADKDCASIILLSKSSPAFLYVYWDKKMIDYFGGTVFDAFQIISEYQGVAKEMIRRFQEEILL